MKRQSSVLLAVTFLAAAVANCFKDPVSSLLSGPSALTVDHSAVFVHAGDSTSVAATLKDRGGNFLDVGTPSWTSVDPTIASVRLDTSLVIPGNSASHAVIKGVTPTGGWTSVIVTARGVADTIRVVVMPPVIPAAQHGYGTPTSQDTLVIPGLTGPPPTPPDTIRYAAPDTLFFTGTTVLHFDTSSVSAYATGPTGTSNGFVAAKTPTQLSVVFTKGASGHVWVRHVLLATSNPNIGTVKVDSLLTADSVLLSRVRYRGAITQTGDTVFFTRPNGIHFGAATVVLFGATQGLLFDTAAGAVLSPAGYTGQVTFQKLGLGTATLDAVTSTASATVTAAGFAFPGALAQAGDTTTLTAAGRVRFDSLTRATVGGVKDSVIGFDSLHLILLAPTGSSGALSVSNTKVGIQRLTLTSAGPYTTTTATVPAATITQTGDTLTVTGAGTMAVDSQTTVVFGATTPTVLRRGANTVSVILGAPSYTGVVTVNKAKVGIARIASLKSAGSYTINQASFLGTVTQLGDTMTVAAPSGVAFDTAKTTIAFGANAAIPLSKSASSYKVLSPATFTGPVTVKNAKFGTVQVPAMITPASYTINGATFPSANVSVGGGLLGDTITITAPAGITFDTAAAKLSGVLAGNIAISTSDTAWILSRTPTTIKAFAKRGGVGAVTVSNLLLAGGTLLPYLSTPTTFAIDSTNYTFANAQTEGAAFPLTIPASNTVTVYGAVSGAISTDFWTFTTTAAHVLAGQLAWFGSGNPGGTGTDTKAYTADLDLLICNAGLACDESVPDLMNYGAASAAQPEKGKTSSARPAAQYWVAVLPYTLGNYSIVYQLTVSLQ
jgi:hypothetical protein